MTTRWNGSDTPIKYCQGNNHNNSITIWDIYWMIVWNKHGVCQKLNGHSSNHQYNSSQQIWSSVFLFFWLGSVIYHTSIGRHWKFSFHADIEMWERSYKCIGPYQINDVVIWIIMIYGIIRWVICHFIQPLHSS